VCICGVLVVLAVATGVHANAHGSGGVHAGVPPILGRWLPHVGVGTPLAVAVAILVVWRGPALARRLPWRTALVTTYAAALAWTFGLALVDGWQRGIALPLVRATQFLSAVPRIDAAGVEPTLRTFTDHILLDSVDHWPTHVAGHPPGATLVFVAMERVGLGGGAWAGAACAIVGCALGAPTSARRILPFCVLSPGAVWVATSADGFFAGATATAVAVFAYGCRTVGTRGIAGCALGGLLLGFALYLSYGFTLLALVVLAVAACAGNTQRAWRSLLVAGLGVASVVLAFTAAGFWWLDGYHLLVQRYYQGIAAGRPYSYWVWANLASLFLATGPAVAAGLGRLRPWIARKVTTAGDREDLSTVDRSGAAARHEGLVVFALSGAAVLAIIAADVSGLSKAEVERIWLPFGSWLVVAVAALPSQAHRRWLAAQAGLALAVNHLVLTAW
jgi:hypothetical protein